MEERNFNHMFLIFLGLFISLECTKERFELTAPNEITWAQFGEVYKDSTPANGSLAVYKYKVKEGQVVRFWVGSNANSPSPLLAVFRETTVVVSVQIPVILQNYMFNSTARTLCPFYPTGLDPKADDLTLSVELSSYRPVQYEFTAKLQENFLLKLDDPQEVRSSVAEPVYVQYNIPDGIDSVVVTVISNNSVCMTVSIQQVGCPVFDLTDNVISTGIHQTMTRSTSITVERRLMEKFYIVFVVRPNDNDCSEMDDVLPPTPRFPPIRAKTFTITVEKSPLVKDYFLPFLITLGGMLVIYVFVICFVLAMSRYETRKLENETRHLRLAVEHDDVSYGSQEPGPSHRRISIGEEGVERRDLRDDSSLDSYDVLLDDKDKEVVRSKVQLTVADMSLKTWKQRDKKYSKYTVSLLTLSLFYGLPVVQLVFNWQDTVRLSGDLDLCWYNFGCARPFLGFFNFNSIFSNIGYIALGFLFLIMVKERDIRYRYMATQFPGDLKNDYGLPQHNGLMYAIGIGIIMEGVLSASYHICPSSANYQFDTSFMYMIGMLGMLKIYQLRHPDINANAHVAFALMAGFIFVAMCGVYYNDLWFWIVFGVAYVLTMFTISIEFYFRGQWRFNPKKIWRSCKYEIISSRRCSCIVPAYKSRFLFLLLANGINLAYIVTGVLTRPKDFPSFLLFPFIANLFLYMLYYIFMKMIHRESLGARAMFYLLLATVCWLTAMWFFMHNVTDWSKTPANSRELNRPCILLDFFDNHDVWHFLSSVALFMSFSLLMCIDDDLMWVRRDKIAVF